MKSILDPKFEYVPAVKTDIRKTFERARQEMAAQRQATLALARTAHPTPQRRRAA